jgi:hypothetical protein
VTRIDREIGPKGYDPYNSASRDRESALEWRWVIYYPPAVIGERAIWFDTQQWIEREMRQLPRGNF